MDGPAFRELYLLMRGDVFTFAARRLDAERAAEVVSSTFEVAWAKRDAAPSDESRRPGWIIGIAKNKVLQERQRSTRKHHDNRFIADHEHQARSLAIDDVEPRVTDAEAAARIFRQLTPTEQQLFDLASVRSLDAGAAAEVLGISATAYSTRLTRLRQRISSLQDQDAETSETAGETR